MYNHVITIESGCGQL